MYRPENPSYEDGRIDPTLYRYVPSVRSGHSQHRRWNAGSRGREAMVTSLRSRISVAREMKDTRKPNKMGVLNTGLC
jgi:hypothetical protein